METPINLDSVRAKIARATEHGDALTNEIGAWYDSHPYAFSRTIEKVDGEGTRWTALITETTPPSTERWALILGDAVHNLRAALDHLFFAIAERHSHGKGLSAKDVRDCHFPVSANVDGFRGFRKTREHLVSAGVWAAIEREQPYSRRSPSGHSFLAVLSKLDIADKHHKLPLLVLPADAGRWWNYGTPESFSVSFEECLLTGIAGVHDETKITSIFIANAAADVNPKLELSFSIRMSYADNQPPAEIADLLSVLYADVLGIVERVSAAVT